MNAIEVKYSYCLIRLTLIILISELLIMLLLGEFGLNIYLPNPWRAFIDGILLLILSAYPVYRWVYMPIVQSFMRKQEEIEMLAEALHGAGDSAIITNKRGVIIYVNDRGSR